MYVKVLKFIYNQEMQVKNHNEIALNNSTNSIPRNNSTEMQAHEYQENTSKNVQSSLIGKSKILKSIQISIYNGMDKLCI